MTKQAHIPIDSDLAEERQRASFCEGGIAYTKRESDGVRVSDLTVLTPQGAQAIGREAGRYITVSYPEPILSASLRERVMREIVEAYRELFPSTVRSLLVVGLGNARLTADSLGHTAASYVIPTASKTGRLSVFLPGTEGQTGVESAALLRSALSAYEPDALLVIDALAASEEGRLLRAIELCDTGIHPGAGIGEGRSAIDARSMGVPTVAVGVPTVMRVGALLDRFGIERSAHPKEALFITPSLLDIGIGAVSHLLADTVHRFFEEVIKK